MLAGVILFGCYPEIISCPVTVRHTAYELIEMRHAVEGLPEGSPLRKVYKEWNDMRDDASGCRWLQRHPSQILVQKVTE